MGREASLHALTDLFWLKYRNLCNLPQLVNFNQVASVMSF